MELDQYKVDVLHYINPHLIWVLVEKEEHGENQLFFEQIGIYGILPQNVTFGIDCVVKTEPCERWMPAATVAMKRVLTNADSTVIFSPTHIDKKISIFDDNIHKYGDLIVTMKDGKQVNLVDELINSEFAYKDECLFHKEIRGSNLNTRLNYITVHEVMRKIEDAYQTRGIPKNIWQNALKNQTMVLQEARHLESSITARNLEKRDRDNVETLLKNKLNDLKLCKNVDEESAGRASSRSSKSSSVVNVALKKKLDWLKSQRIENVPKQKVEDDDKSADGTDGKAFVDQQDDGKISPNSYEDDDDCSENGCNNFTKKGTKPQKAVNTEVKLVAYGPAGLQASKFAIKQDTRQDKEPVIEEKRTPKPEPEIEEGVKEEQDVYANTDSEVNLKITNLEILKKIKAKNAMLNNFVANKSKAVDSKSKALEAMRRKLKYIEERKAKANECLSSTSDKDSSKCDLDSDNESLTALKIELGLHNPKVKKDVNSEPQPVTFDIDVRKSYVNPFKNLDGSISVFVEKLVSPVLMVHTKKDNRIQPVSNMRDIPFGNDIHMVLRNMSIQKPMRPQTVSWPTILRGHSVFLVGPFNSGNTIGYLPAVCRLVSDFKNTPDKFGLSCIIVCATSHSVAAVESACKMFLHNAKIFACYTGISDLDITTSLLNGCDLLICTPTMLVRLIQEDFSLDFRNLTTFVVDDCEHISKVYPKELKFCLLKVKDIVKNRAHKEWKVQYVIVSRIWCDFMSSLAKKAPDSVVCISAFEECVLYSKAATSVEFVKQENKLDSVINFLKGIDKSKKSVIVCRADEEVKMLEKALSKLKYIVFSCSSTMTVQDLYNLDKTLRDYQEPVSGPVLVCCDGNLTHLNVTDAHYLVHYSLPDLFSTFCKRFAVLIDNYSSVFKDEDSKIKIKILLDDNNIEQLPKILNFIKRCTQDVSPFLNEISSSVLSEKDLKKAQNLVPICRKLMALGKCPDFWNCIERHSIFKEYDDPKPWLPKEGVITFQILHYHSAVSYSARVSSCITKNNTLKYSQTYSLLSIKMGMYYSKEENRKLHGEPKVGDVTAVTLKQNLFVRCQVSKVLKSKNNQPTLLLVKLIDEEKYEIARDTWLYYLPDELKNIETHVVTVILANLVPQDKDVTFSKLAEGRLKRVTDENDDIYMRGQIAMVVGNTIFVDTLEACQDLSSLEEVVVKCDFVKELLDGHAMRNPDHIDNLRKIYDYNISDPKKDVKCVEVPPPIKVLPKVNILPKGRWAHLESDGFSSVFFMYAENPCQFFVRPIKFDSCLTMLIKDIKKHVSENPETVENTDIGDIVLAEFPDDATYERARIDGKIINNKVKCFFVDQAEWREVSIKKILPITEKLITQLPFQAIECRLVGIQPFGDNWTDFSTNFFVDSCFDSVDKHKQLYTKYFTKEKAKFTEGHKYGVVLIDTYSEEDIIINQMMIDKNLAQESEVVDLNDLGFHRKSEESSDTDSNIDDKPSQMEKAVVLYDKNKQTQQLPTNKPGKLLRSVPLISSDPIFDNFDLVSDDSGNVCSAPISEWVAIKRVPNAEWNEKVLASSIGSNQPSKNNCVSKPSTVNSEQFSKPKLLWRQNTNTVTIKINLIVESYDLTIKERYIKFSANANDTKYEFDFELYGVVKLSECSHSNKGLYIQVKLWKVMPINWLTLTRDGAVKKWIVYDVESIEVTSDAESEVTVDKNNFITNHNDSDSDENMQDDVSFSY